MTALDLRNPTIPGFHPDPSIVRVGDDYYLACSSFEYLPGVPIFHSRDLSSWTLVGHVADRVGQLAVEDTPTLGGSWAPTLRHHDGLFWVAVTDAMGRGVLMFTAKDPAGPWSDGTVIEGADGIDQDLAWDEDGTCYMTYSALHLTGPNRGAHGGIEQVRIDPVAGRVLEEPRSLWSGTGLMFPEAPHLYRIGGWWYLMIAEGGTERGHSVSIARSRRPDGPFEGAPTNPVLSARSTARPVQNTGHGDLVQLSDGQWAMVLLGMRTRGGTRGFSPMGRETFTTAVTWVDGWPVVEPVELSPAAGPMSAGLVPADGTLGGEWIGLRALPADVVSFEDDAIRVHGGEHDLDHPRASLVGIRQAHDRVRFAVTVAPSPGVGGLTVRYDEKHHYDVEVDGPVVRARARLAGVEQTWTAPRPDGDVTLWLETRPPEGGPMLALAPDEIRLGFGGGDGLVELATVDGRYLSAETAASFTGRLLGVHARQGDLLVRRVRYDGVDN